MMATVGPSYGGLKKMLQSAIQSVQWTYVIFWQLCPQQRVLVWGDGYYNGAIKTRKTVQPVDVSTEEAALSRSEQLRELYDSLATGDQQVGNNLQQTTIRRPSVALSPEDLTESEWFYLMCISFSFPPGEGLVGEAYAKQQHLWLTGANAVDSKIFTRAILAKSAHIQTVVCIPLLNGVVELGTTKKVVEAVEFIQHVTSFFAADNDNPILPPPKPALSAHSSNTTLSSDQMTATIEPPEYASPMDEEDVDEEEEEDEEDEENGSDFEAEMRRLSGVQEPHQDKAEMAQVMEANELLQLDMSEDIRLGSPNDGSNNLDSGFHLLATSQVDSCKTESASRWVDDLELKNPLRLQLQASESPGLEELAQEDSHYSHTVSTILNNQLSRRSDSQSASGQHSVCSSRSSFVAWTSKHHHCQRFPSASSQWLLKDMLFTIPFLHSNIRPVEDFASESVASRLRKTSSHEELSANHVLAERRRREKLNERFIILRSMVPLVTKMDKASILGDTIEYVKQLRKKIEELEAGAEEDGLDRSKRKIRAVAGRRVQVEVSIIESDALVELQCPHREGLLLDVMKKLREVGVEITTIESSMNDGMCTAEMRAKVKAKAKAKSNNVKKTSITQVKKAINRIISPHSV